MEVFSKGKFPKWKRNEKVEGHQLARDEPEHEEEASERDDGIDDHEEEIQHARGEKFHVFRDALARIMDALGAVDAVVGAVVKVALNEALREPTSPGEPDARLPFRPAYFIAWQSTRKLLPFAISRSCASFFFFSETPPFSLTPSRHPSLCRGLDRCHKSQLSGGQFHGRSRLSG